jgi:hypothetical protein
LLPSCIQPKLSQQLIYLAKSELLGQNDDGSRVDDSENSKSGCDTQAFLLGLTSAWIHFCSQSLTELFAEKGASAFDVKFLLASAVTSDKDRLLFASAPTLNKRQHTIEHKPKFSGSTYFFFLACGLLRVGLHPAIAMEHELQDQARDSLNLLRKATIAKSQLPAHILARLNPMVASLFGWRVFLEDPEFIKTVTDFCLLQLDFVLQSCRSEASTLARSIVPDFMVKDPSRWLTRVARTTAHLLTPKQAAKAVERSAELLQLGERNNSFSPIVVACLLRIASAFVGAGIFRAYQKQQRRRQGGKLRMAHHQANNDHEDDNNEEEDDFYDTRNIDLYLSFDQNVSDFDKPRF